MKAPRHNKISVKKYMISKYKHIEIEIEKIWHLKTTTVPVLVGALGMIKKGAYKQREREREGGFGIK